MLLRCISHSRYFSKIIVFSENKRKISFKIKHFIKPVIILTRTLSQSTGADTVIGSKFMCLNNDMFKKNQIEKDKYEDIVQQIKSQNDVDSIQAHSLLKWANKINDCSPQDKLKLIESLWINLVVCNFKLSVIHYNALLEFYVNNNHNFSPTDMLMEMRDKGVIPNYITYHICSIYYCMKGNINEALLLLKYTRIPVQYLIHYFNTLLIGYSQLRNLEAIDKILNIMEYRHIKPTADTYAAIMYTYAKLNNMDKIKEIIQTCHSRKIYFTNTHILRVIYTLAVNNHIESIDAMYKYLKKTLNISNEEMQVIIDIFNIDQINIVTTSFLHILLRSHEEKFTSMKPLLSYAIDKNVKPDKIIDICNSSKDDMEIYKELLSYSLYYSLSRNSHISLALLRICKPHYTVKAHYFWPLFVSLGEKYDLDGVLNILSIMINEFNIAPCVHTISDYILSMLVVKGIDQTRKLLIKYNVNETVINNGFVLMFLKEGKPLQAAIYVRAHPDKYFYNILSHELRQASAYQNDVESFILISNELLENSTNNYKHKDVFVSMDKQLFDAMIDMAPKKLWLAKLVQHLVARNIRLKPETIQAISNHLCGYLKDDVISGLENLSKKTPNMQVNLL